MDATERVGVPLWTGIVAGPLAWAADLEIQYAILHYVCLNHAQWILWAITAAALLITAFGALCSWRGWIDDTPRVRFMAMSGLLISAAFAISIVAMAIPEFFLRPCD
jgi:hypothetical protein